MPISCLNFYTNKLIFSFTFLIAFSGITHMNSQENLPPLIDREILFGNPEISSAKLSPTGKFISFIKPYKGVRNIWVKGRYDSFDAAIPITADKDRPIRGYFWSRDEKYVLFVQDKGGNEDFQVYAVDPDGEINERTGVPQARNITDLSGVRAIIMSVPKSNSEIMYVGLNDRDPAWHDLYEINISTGKRKLIYLNDQKFTGFYFDLNDELTLASSSDSEGGTIIYKKTDDGFVRCYECSVDETCYPVRASKDKNQFYFVSNKGNVDLTGLGILNLKTNNFELLESDPSNQVDFDSALFSEKTNELISTQYTGDKVRIYWKDKVFQTDYNFFKRQFPDAECTITSMTDNEAMWIVYVNSDTDPGAAYLYRREDKNIEFLYRPRPNLPTEHLAKMIPVKYKSSDGLEISAYLTLPKGVVPEYLPAIINPHGGPWARDNWGYNSFAQFLANRGYAVLQPNFRGSTGFGKAFLNAGNNEWGQLMQDDLTAGVEFLIKEGYANPNRIGIMGGSYGGYATLAGLTFTPDIYAAGVSIVGPSNLFTLLETIPAYWESFRKVFHKRMGDPSTEEGKEQMKRQSPFFHANNIKVPLLVAQGNNDPRVKTAESDQIVVAMRELGLPVEYMNFMDEGHGFANPDNNIAFLSVAEKFLAAHLGGRYQEETTAEIARIVKENTVDINTVTLPIKMTEEMKNSSLPRIVKQPEIGIIKYQKVIELGPKKILIELDREVKIEEEQIIISHLSKFHNGDGSEISYLDKNNMEIVKKIQKQGPMHLELEIKDNLLVGHMSMQGNKTPFDKKLDQNTFDSGDALFTTLSCLEIKESYSSIIRSLDATNQRINNYQFEVISTEKITSGDKIYQCYKAELKSLDGDGNDYILWFEKDGYNTLVKATGKLKEMNGASITVTRH